MPLSETYEIKGVEYDPGIPTIEDITGSRAGLRHTLPHEIIEYFKVIAERSDRVSFREYGRTYEGTPLIYAAITSPDNQARLEEIRKVNLKLAEQPETLSPADLKEMPLVIYIGCGIHGNESSGGDAATMLLYHLAAGRGSMVEDLLDRMVILLDPMINPDGRNRFVGWVNGNRGRVPTADLSDREHNEPWPGGRSNHYWYDMNRDMLPVALKETAFRLQLFYHWRPQLVTDHHEQGRTSTFFFQPGIPSGNNPNTPKSTVDLTGRIAEYHARELDRIGSLYFSGEVYDDFYYGKGSSYPDINGAVGILFEQASSRSLLTRGANGEMSYGFTVRNQLATMISTLKAGMELRRDLLANQRDFYLSADEFFRESPVKGYVFSMPEDPLLAEAFIGLLRHHQIRVCRLSRELKVETEIYRPEDSWIVPLNQKQARLIKALFEEVTEFRDVVFYDISAWTLPHAYGLRFDGFPDSPERYTGAEVLAEDLTQKGEISGGEASYAYVLKWNLWAPGALYMMMDQGLSARAFCSELEAMTGSGSPAFKGTSVVIPVPQEGVSPDKVHQAVREAAERFPVAIQALDSGLSSKGPFLGSSTALLLRKPAIALMTGDGVSSSEAGEAWYMLDERMEIPVSLIDNSRLGNLDLSAYNCLVLPGGAYRSWKEPEIEKLKAWVKEGGTLITMRNSVKWAIEAGIIDEELVKDEAPVLDLPYAELGKARRGQTLSGAIFGTRLDNTHPLAFGYCPDLPVFRNHTDKLKPSKVPGANVAVYRDNPLLSGYLPEEQKGRIGGTAAIIARRSGSGAVVLFIDDPNFRGHWWGTSRIFLNAVFFGHTF